MALSFTYKEREQVKADAQEMHSAYVDDNYIGTIYYNEGELPYSFLPNSMFGAPKDHFNAVYDKRLSGLEAKDLDAMKGMIELTFHLMKKRNDDYCAELKQGLETVTEFPYSHDCHENIDLEHIAVSVCRTVGKDCLTSIWFPVKLTIDQFAKLHFLKKHGKLVYSFHEVRFKHIEGPRSAKYGFSVSWTSERYTANADGFAAKRWRHGDINISVESCVNVAEWN